MPKKPLYTRADRHPYHFGCTVILDIVKKSSLVVNDQTHACWCSAWKKQEDGTFLQWRDNEWKAPKRGVIKSKPLIDL